MDSTGLSLEAVKRILADSPEPPHALGTAELLKTLDYHWPGFDQAQRNIITNLALDLWLKTHGPQAQPA